MEFAPSKDLRTLSVVEFALLLIRAATDWPIGYNLIITALEISTYIALLVLLRRDVRICEDSLITTVITLATVTLVIQLLKEMLNLIPDKCLWEEEERDQEAHADSIRDDRMQRYKEWFTGLCNWKVVTYPLSLIFVLVILAWGIFCFATLIKLAIPDDSRASCVDNSNVSKVIMLGIPIGTIACHTAVMYAKIGLALYPSRVNAAKIQVLNVLLGSIFLPVRVLTFILLIRLSKVWRGEELELYEYVGLSVCLPLLSSHFSGFTCFEE